ncbi:hypothetical protein KI387_006044, partial [Taxus chinensis]
TMYGAKATIKSELIANFHIKPHVPSLISAYFLAFDQEECSNDHELDTKVGNIPDLILDEWENKRHAFDPYKEMEEFELGLYCVHKDNSSIPSLTKLEDKDDNELWITPKRSTSSSPYKFVYGKEVVFPLSLELPALELMKQLEFSKFEPMED